MCYGRLQAWITAQSYGCIFLSIRGRSRPQHSALSNVQPFVSQDKCEALAQVITANYFSSNPYHNATHALDVL